MNGTALAPQGCPQAAWLYAPFPEPSSVAIQNTGPTDLAYLVEQQWYIGETPGRAGVGPTELYGVLAPGQQVDITVEFGAGLMEYQGGTVAILGSWAPFSPPNLSTAYDDEGTIAWPNSVAGSNGESSMHVAQIDIGPCERINGFW